MTCLIEMKRFENLKTEKKILQEENRYLTKENEITQSEFAMLNGRIKSLEKKNKELREDCNKYLRELIFYRDKCQVDLERALGENNDQLNFKFDVIQKKLQRIFRRISPGSGGISSRSTRRGLRWRKTSEMSSKLSSRD